MPSLLIYLSVAAAAFALTVPSVLLCKKLAFRTGILDVPKSEGHKQHRNATPLLGGAAMAAGWLLTILAGLVFAYFAGILPDGFRTVSLELAVLILCALGAMVLGLLDDIRPMKAGKKFAGQLLIALIAVLCLLSMPST